MRLSEQLAGAIAEAKDFNPDEIVVFQKTADNIRVILWSDGSITSGMGFKLKGIPLVRPKTKAKLDLAIRVGSMLLGDLSLYDASELGAAYKAYKWATEKHKTPGEARTRFHKAAGGGAKKTTFKPKWEVLRADRKGKPTERVWRLPRMRWPGLVVWDHMGKWRGGRERYELVNLDRGGIAKGTGFTFKNMVDLEQHLLGLKW